MPIRSFNPFAKRPGNDENIRPELLNPADASHPGFERVDTVGSKASSALSIRSAKSQDTGDYKMSGTHMSIALRRDLVAAVASYRAHSG